MGFVNKIFDNSYKVLPFCLGVFVVLGILMGLLSSLFQEMTGIVVYPNFWTILQGLTTDLPPFTILQTLKEFSESLSHFRLIQSSIAILKLQIQLLCVVGNYTIWAFNMFLAFIGGTHSLPYITLTFNTPLGDFFRILL